MGGSKSRTGLIGIFGNSMGKLFSILMSYMVLLQSFTIDLGDIAQFDELLEHASFHYQKYGDNFFVFVSKHYGELQNKHNKEHQEEKKEHEQLPFNHQSCSHYFMAFVLTTAHVPLLKLDPFMDTSPDFFYRESYSLFEKTDIFQPPKHI